MSATAPNSHTASWSNVRMTLVVQAPGHDAFSVEHSCMCRADKWPAPGMELPVAFDARDRERIDVDWKRVPSARDRARQQAEAMVQALSGGGAEWPRR